MSEDKPEEKQEEITEETQEVKEENAPRLGKTDFLSMIASALSQGEINSDQARKLREEIGVMKSEFTKKKTKKRKAKRKAESKARKTTIQKGYKGQKFHHLGGTRGR